MSLGQKHKVQLYQRQRGRKRENWQQDQTKRTSVKEKWPNIFGEDHFTKDNRKDNAINTQKNNSDMNRFC